MDPDYEEIASEIIALHKADAGHFFNWNDFFIKYINDDAFLKKAISVRKLLLSKGVLVEEESKIVTWLTEKGGEWKGFAEERQQAAKKAKLDKAESWPKRHWILFPFITGAIGVVFGISGEAIKKNLWPEQKLSAPDSTTKPAMKKTSKPYLYDSSIHTKTGGG